MAILGETKCKSLTSNAGLYLLVLLYFFTLIVPFFLSRYLSVAAAESTEGPALVGHKGVGTGPFSEDSLSGEHSLSDEESYSLREQSMMERMRCRGKPNAPGCSDTRTYSSTKAQRVPLHILCKEDGLNERCQEARRHEAKKAMKVEHFCATHPQQKGKCTQMRGALKKY